MNAGPYKRLAQKTKSERLAFFLRSQGYTHAVCAPFDQTQWRLAAMAAGVNFPSSETQAMILDLLEKIEQPVVAHV